MSIKKIEELTFKCVSAETKKATLINKNVDVRLECGIEVL